MKQKNKNLYVQIVDLQLQILKRKLKLERSIGLVIYKMTEQKCQHKWKIIREEEGYKHEFFHGDYYVIYHLQCKNCGKVIDFKAHSEIGRAHV